jgi:hypothetical protein
MQFCKFLTVVSVAEHIGSGRQNMTTSVSLPETLFSDRRDPDTWEQRRIATTVSKERLRARVVVDGLAAVVALLRLFAC